MKTLMIALGFILITCNIFSQEGRGMLFLGIQPSITKEKFYEKKEFDVNIMPLVFQGGWSWRQDWRIVTLVNYHIGTNSGFSDIGIELGAPYFLNKRSELKQYSKGAFFTPVISFTRNTIFEHYTTTLAMEVGYSFLVSESFAVMTQVQYGSSLFMYDQKDNERVSHFGIKVNLGFWF